MSCTRRATAHGSENRSDKPAGRREYNEERPKKGLGGLTPFQYAKRLMRGTQYSHHRTLNRSATEDGGTS